MALRGVAGYPRDQHGSVCVLLWEGSLMVKLPGVKVQATRLDGTVSLE